ncbi:MAG: hypothetical protein HQ530_05195 [Parcubacteria group bacterium]|nr:hypothetical protein [Parcubacteria group bacterium]
MKIFYGAAIQGAPDRAARAHIHQAFIDYIKTQGHEVAFDHTRGKNREDSAALLEKKIGALPPTRAERAVPIRQEMIKTIEEDVEAAIFEVSTPSLGTGIEIAHAYLRPRLGLSSIPVLALYERDFWPNNLSSMLRGITPAEVPDFTLREYVDLEAAKNYIGEFLRSI